MTKSRSDQIIDDRLTRGKRLQAELDREIAERGGVLRWGLYHGNRRVRAKDDFRTWRLCSDETDLIAALGRASIPSNANRIDLKKKYGLEERMELAPARTEIDKYGDVDIVRTDEWGEGASLSFARDPWWSRLFSRDSLWLWMLFVLAPHVYISMWISEKLTLFWNKFACSVLLGCFFFLPMLFPTLIDRGLGHALAWMYFSLPAYVFLVMSYNERRI